LISVFHSIIPLPRRVRIPDNLVALRHSDNTRENNCLRCASSDAHQKEGWRENGQEGRAAVPRAVTNEGARSAGKPMNVIQNVAF
jgi:hypothetical protein